MANNTMCPVCQRAPWNDADGSDGVCPACLLAAEGSAKPKTARKARTRNAAGKFA